MSSNDSSSSSSSSSQTNSCICKTVLVTGGGGYVGSHTTVELLNHGYSVIAIDSLVNCYAKDRKPEALKRVEKITGKQLIFYEADIRNRKDLESVFIKVITKHV